jgi:polyhydroxybutyrate depolymerase
MALHFRALAAVALALGARTAVLSAQSARPALSNVAGEPRTLLINGDSRRYYLHLPPGWRRDHPAPLVLVFHAGGGRARDIAPHTGFSRVSDRERFVVVYPQGLRGRWNDGRGFVTATHDDVGFVRALLDTLGRELAIDPKRIYATGISNGAMFAYRLACDLPGTFAAVAPVAGALPAELAPSCARTAPVSVVAFQGTADPLMPYLGGGAGQRRVLSAERSLNFWATLAGCTGAPVSTDEPDRVADGTRVRHSTWLGCREGRSVELYTIEGGGHTWPGGPEAGRRVGRVTREIDATGVIWGFFAGHGRP